MYDTAADRALVEISLALAMAFFALMVLALVGMGVPPSELPAAAPTPAELAVAQARAESVPDPAPEAAPAPFLVVHWQGRWLDTDLRPLNPQALPLAGRRLVVALDPSATLAEARAVQAAVAPVAASLTVLTPEWLDRLEAL